MPGPIAGALDTCKPGRFLGDERPFIPGIIRRGDIREPFGVGLKPPPTLPTLIKKHKYIFHTSNLSMYEEKMVPLVTLCY